MKTQASESERWVCSACGRITEAGGHRYDLKDGACVMHAVLCHAQTGLDGKWRAVDVRDGTKEPEDKG